MMGVGCLQIFPPLQLQLKFANFPDKSNQYEKSVSRFFISIVDYRCK